MANPYLVQPVSIGGGLAGLGQSLMQAGQIKQQREKEQELADKQAAANAELESTIGELEAAMQNKDYDTINSIALRYPDRAKIATQALNDEDKRKRDNVVNVGFEFLRNPQNYEQILKDNPVFTESVGGYDEAVKRMQTEPDKVMDEVSALLAWEGGDQWKQFREHQKSQQPETMTPYQAATVEGKRIDQQLRQQEIDLKRAESKAKSAKTEQEREKAELDIKAKQQKLSETKNAANTQAIDAVASADEGLDLIGKIENHPGFSSYVGVKGASSLFGLKDQPVAGSEAAGVAALIETLSSQQFMSSIQNMKGMGALSDAEGKKLSAAISSLDPNMSEQDFKRSLNTIRRFFNRAKAKASSRIKQTPETSTQEVKTVNWSDM